MKRMAKDKSLPQSFWTSWVGRASRLLVVLGISVVGFVAITAGVTAAMPWVSAKLWPVERLELAGDLQRVSVPMLQETATPYFDNGLLAADLSLLAAEVKQLDWVGDVHVQRVWPNTLRIEIVEQVPVARWSQVDNADQVDGRLQANRLLMQNGRIVVMPESNAVDGSETAVDASFALLPEIVGSGVGGQAVVVELKQINQLLQQHGYELNKFAVAAYGGRNLLLKDANDGALLIKLPRQQTYVVLERFIRHANEIFTRRLDDFMGRKPAVVDLRYQNGFAVRWRPAAGESSVQVGG